MFKGTWKSTDIGSLRFIEIMSKYSNNTVSVIIPVYNKERYLANTIESIINQSYKDWEIILVDDCSTDNSAKTISRYTEKYPNIVYHKQEKNGGAAVARNTALTLAKGRYAAFLDADDEWYPNKLEKQLEFMASNNTMMSCTALECVDEDGKPLNSIRPVKRDISYEFLLKNTMIATSTVIVDRNKTGDFQMPLRRRGQDYATWLKLLRSGENCLGLNDVLTKYRVMKDSLSSNKWSSIKQVWEIQTINEGINKFKASINIGFFIFNALRKRIRK